MSVNLWINVVLWLVCLPLLCLLIMWGVFRLLVIVQESPEVRRATRLIKRLKKSTEDEVADDVMTARREKDGTVIVEKNDDLPERFFAVRRDSEVGQAIKLSERLMKSRKDEVTDGAMTAKREKGGRIVIKKNEASDPQ